MVRITYYQPEYVDLTDTQYEKLIANMKQERELLGLTWYRTDKKNMIVEMELTSDINLLMTIESYNVKVKDFGYTNAIADIKKLD